MFPIPFCLDISSFWKTKRLQLGCNLMMRMEHGIWDSERNIDKYDLWGYMSGYRIVSRLHARESERVQHIKKQTERIHFWNCFVSFRPRGGGRVPENSIKYEKRKKVQTKTQPIQDKHYFGMQCDFRKNWRAHRLGVYFCIMKKRATQWRNIKIAWNTYKYNTNH